MVHLDFSFIHNLGGTAPESPFVTFPPEFHADATATAPAAATSSTRSTTTPPPPPQAAAASSSASSTRLGVKERKYTVEQLRWAATSILDSARSGATMSCAEACRQQAAPSMRKTLGRFMERVWALDGGWLVRREFIMAYSFFKKGNPLFEERRIFTPDDDELGSSARDIHPDITLDITPDSRSAIQKIKILDQRHRHSRGHHAAQAWGWAAGWPTSYLADWDGGIRMGSGISR